MATDNLEIPEFLDRRPKAKATKVVARPLRVLVPLIRNELIAGDRAGLEYYRRAGEMLVEAKEQIPHGSWTRWLTKNFQLSQTTAKRYMRLARAADDGDDNFKTTPGGRFRTLKDAIGEPPARAENLEREAERKLALQLIDTGYRALAVNLHPDRGGSPEVMARLNAVRARLRAVAGGRR